MTKLEFLLPLQGNEADMALIDMTLLLAQSLDGQVTTIYAQNDPADMLAWPIDGSFAMASVSLLDNAQNGSDEAWHAQEARILERVKTAPSLSIERIIGFPETQIARRGTLSDMVVFSCDSARGKTLISGIFTAALMDALAPILIVRGEPKPKLDKIAIAWDGGLEVSRAAKAALPFLKTASEVIILQSADALDEFDRPQSDPSRLFDWLTRHEISSRVEVIASSKDVAVDILTACTSLSINLLVCGAYGHSRAREFVFGGVTRTLIKTTTSPSLFLSH
jgi:nucleotide-binding universal stress UspA family protein